MNNVEVERKCSNTFNKSSEIYFSGEIFFYFETQTLNTLNRDSEGIIIIINMMR